MTTALFYFGANIVALTANMLLGAGILISLPRSFAARIFACVTLSSVCYLLGRLSYAVPPEVQVHFAAFPLLNLLMNMGAGFWMILAYTLFQDGARIPRWLIAAFVVQSILSAINALGYIGHSSSVFQSEAYPPGVNFVFGPLPIALQIGFEIVALFWALRGWRVDLDEARRVLRAVFVFLVGGLLFGTGVIELSLIDASLATREPFDNAVTVFRAVGYVTVALVALRFDRRVFERIAVRAAPAPGQGGAGFDRDLARLIRALEVEKVYLEPGLSIGGLATHLDLPEYRLRRVIHERLGYRNFNALLHDYRLKDACVRLSNPSRMKIPILTIALEVGYQSIAPFNQAFRAATGLTPSAYRQAHAQPSRKREDLLDS